MHLAGRDKRNLTGADAVLSPPEEKSAPSLFDQTDGIPVMGMFGKNPAVVAGETHLESGDFRVAPEFRPICSRVLSLAILHFVRVAFKCRR